MKNYLPQGGQAHTGHDTRAVPGTKMRKQARVRKSKNRKGKIPSKHINKRKKNK